MFRRPETGGTPTEDAAADELIRLEILNALRRDLAVPRRQ